MKLIEIAQKINKSKHNEEWVDVEKLACELSVDFSYEYDTEQSRLKCYWIGNWYCTDSYVGYKMYFLDNEPAAFSIQQGRKCYEEFSWFSRDVANKTKDYLLSIIAKSELNITTCDIHDDIGESYKINFNSQMLKQNIAVLNGEKVEIIERIKNEPHGLDTELKIKLPSGQERNVDIRDLEFNYYIV